MNPFESEMGKSEFFLDGESEEKSLKSIRQRIETHPSIKGHSEKSNFQLYKLLMIAASFIAIIVVSFFLFRSDDTSNFRQIADQNFEHYPNYQNINVRGEDDIANLINAYNAYDNKDYGTAAKIFSSYESGLSNIDKLYFAITCIGINDYNKAKAILSNLKNLESGEYRYAYSYFYGLSLLAKGDKEQAILLLEPLSTGDSQFAEKASAMLKLISS